MGMALTKTVHTSLAMHIIRLFVFLRVALPPEIRNVVACIVVISSITSRLCVCVFWLNCKYLCNQRMKLLGFTAISYEWFLLNTFTFTCTGLARRGEGGRRKNRQLLHGGAELSCLPQGWGAPGGPHLTTPSDPQHTCS